MIAKEKVTFSFLKETAKSLKEQISNRNRSKFISITIKKQLRKLREQALMKECKESKAPYHCPLYRVESIKIIGGEKNGAKAIT